MTAPNPLRGEARLGPHDLRVNFNAWCALEALTGMKVPALLKAMQTGLGFSELRYFVRAFVAAPLSDEEAGELIDAVGYQTTLDTLRDAIEGFFTPLVDGKAARPTKAAA